MCGRYTPLVDDNKMSQHAVCRFAAGGAFDGFEGVRGIQSGAKVRYDIVYLKSLLISVMMSDIDKIMSFTMITKVSVDYY